MLLLFLYVLGTICWWLIIFAKIETLANAFSNSHTHTYTHTHTHTNSQTHTHTHTFFIIQRLRTKRPTPSSQEYFEIQVWTDPDLRRKPFRLHYDHKTQSGSSTLDLDQEYRRKQTISWEIPYDYQLDHLRPDHGHRLTISICLDLSLHSETAWPIFQTNTHESWP